MSANDVVSREISGEIHVYDESNDEVVAVRPQLLSDFIGQKHLKENLSVFINAATQRTESLDHILFYGPPGLGKTTLSQIIANELKVNIKVVSGAVLAKIGDLAAILTNLQMRDVLFIDEIHRLNIAVEEFLYSAMEDFAIDLIIGDGPAARTVRINLAPFTLVGATTRLGLLTNPLKDRFGIQVKLDFYHYQELQLIVKRCAYAIKIGVTEEAALEIAKRSRGTPRVAIRLLRRIRDFAEVDRLKTIDIKIVNKALFRLRIDKIGLDELDYKYLKYVANNHRGGPVGIETIVAGLSEDRMTMEDVVEPYLMQMGFLSRTPRGRILTQGCLDYLNTLLQ
ncbi:Holliday junction branch migration complex subunit RuvB [Alphaproteobacteria bacterium]